MKVVCPLHIEYICRHCRQKVGEVRRPDWSLADAEARLGVSEWTEAERLDSIRMNPSGTMQVYTVCDYCHHAAKENPQLLVEGKLLQ